MRFFNVPQLISFEIEHFDFRSFAIQAHKDQKYGAYPYSLHLALVEDFLVAGEFHETKYKAAGWLHDVLEDCNVTIHHLRKLFGEEITGLVWACTGEGRNRQERNKEIYRKLKLIPAAAPVKVADRLANISFGLMTGSDKTKMYLEEWPEFKANVGSLMTNDTRSSLLWARLENIIEKVENYVTSSK